MTDPTTPERVDRVEFLEMVDDLTDRAEPFGIDPLPLWEECVRGLWADDLDSPMDLGAWLDCDNPPWLGRPFDPLVKLWLDEPLRVLLFLWDTESSSRLGTSAIPLALEEPSFRESRLLFQVRGGFGTLLCFFGRILDGPSSDRMESSLALTII